MREPEPQADSYKEEFFMASNYTDNYQLCQWEATDQVQRTEFNVDNAKIDAALAKTCQPYLIGYHGDGTDSRTVTFPGKPLFVMVIGGATMLVASRGLNKAHLLFNVVGHYQPSLVWTENSLTWTSSPYAANDSNQDYQLFALLSME